MRMGGFFLALILTLGLCGVTGATDVPAGAVNGTWNAAGSPYNILGAITVLPGESLSMEPGTVVQFQGPYDLTVQGVLNVAGTASDSVLITGETMWDEIRLESETDACSFAYASINGAEIGIHSVDAPVTIAHCRLSSMVTALYISGVGESDPPTVLIDQCLIEDCQQHGIFLVENSNTTISNCEITRCALDNSPRGAIQLSNQSAGVGNDPTIVGNWIHHNTWQGLTAFDITGGGRIRPTVCENVIEYNLTGVYLLYASGELRNNHINYNFVEGNPNSGAGVMVSGAAAHPVLTGNEITGNFTALYVVEGATVNLGDLGNANPDDDGENLIYGNVDMYGNTWSVYSNSTADIMAENNTWDSTDYGEIAVTIYDGNDNPAYGIVDFDPIRNPAGAPSPRVSGRPIMASLPNPCRVASQIVLRLSNGIDDPEARLAVYDAAGRLVRALSHGPLGTGLQRIAWDGCDQYGRRLPAGHYLLRLDSRTQTAALGITVMP